MFAQHTALQLPQRQWCPFQIYLPIPSWPKRQSLSSQPVLSWPERPSLSSISVLLWPKRLSINSLPVLSWPQKPSLIVFACPAMENEALSPDCHLMNTEVLLAALNIICLLHFYWVILCHFWCKKKKYKQFALFDGCSISLS